MKFRKLVVTSLLTFSLTVSSASAFAASINDTVGLNSEVSINKLVALGIFSGAKSFNPEGSLTRADFSAVLARIINLGKANAVKIKDVNAKDARYGNIAKVVSRGLLKLNAKGEFQPSKGVTYAELSRALAYGLGFKLSWTNRPVDFLFYLDRREVLDIDTDLDAVVTREDAAVAVDKYLTLKKQYNMDSGVVSELTATGLKINNGSEYVTYKLAVNAALFLDDQSAEPSNFGAGTPVELILNAKKEIVFASGSGLGLEEGTIVYESGKVKINSAFRNIDLNAVFGSLPNNPSADFTFDNFGKYSSAGVLFGGQAYSNNKTDEITSLNLYVKKVEGRAFTVAGSKITLDFSEDALANQTFTVAESVTITLESDAAKTLTLADLIALQTQGNKLSGSIEFSETGEVTLITAKAEPAKAE